MILSVTEFISSGCCNYSFLCQFEVNFEGNSDCRGAFSYCRDVWLFFYPWLEFGNVQLFTATPIMWNTYAAPVWSNTLSSNYRQLQILQSKCLCVIGNYSRRTPITHLHTALNLEPIRDFIFHLTEKFFLNCPTNPNALVREIRNYSVADLHRQYKKYIHKRTKHLLL